MLLDIGCIIYITKYLYVFKVSCSLIFAYNIFYMKFSTNLKVVKIVFYFIIIILIAFLYF